jgi:predicted anti-sigma-YlaC factor YlaD
MNCETARYALSAMLDGEPATADPVDVEAHIEGCANCQAWRETVHELTRRARLVPASESIIPSREVLEHLRRTAAPRARHDVDALRIALVVVALLQLGLTLPLLLFGRNDLVRDFGGSDMALFVGFLIAALRPTRASVISPVVGTAAGLLVVMALIDLIGDRTTLLAESPHAVAFAGWLLVMRIGRLAPPSLDHPDRSLIRSVRLWMGGAAHTGFSTFATQSPPPAAHLGAEAPVAREAAVAEAQRNAA